mgnify:CR=1 FL=1
MEYNFPVIRTTHPKPRPADETKLGFAKYFTDHMFVMDYDEGQGWHDGRIVPYGPLALEPSAMVLHYAQEVFRKAGVEEHFTHGLGHGVGLDTHELPSFHIYSEGPLEPGMTVTVEPGLYYPGQCGVRLEVTVLVEENGITVL